MKRNLHFKKAITGKSAVIISVILLLTIVIIPLNSELLNDNRWTAKFNPNEKLALLKTDKLLSNPYLEKEMAIASDPNNSHKKDNVSSALGGSFVAGYRYEPDARIYVSKSASSSMDRISFPMGLDSVYEADAVSLGATGTHWPGNPTVVKPAAGCFAVPSLLLDTDGDGIDDSVDIDDDNDGILDVVECPASLSSSLSPILYFNDAAGRLIEYNVDTTTRTELCTGLTAYGDIAISTDEIMYGIADGANELDIIDLSDCSVSNVSTSYSGNSLSFIPDGNMLIGQIGNSAVFKIDPATPATPPTLWHNFSAGYPNGDFIFLNGKIYILWNDSLINPTNPIIFEVTVDASYNYVSHMSLGSVTRFTFGLAKAKGKLYGVAGRSMDMISPPGELFEIPLRDLTPKILIRTEVNDLYGATSLDEGFAGHCDIDGDGILHLLDLDSDNDGISDLTESGFANPEYDLNNDGTISIAEAEMVLGSGMADMNNDGLLDIFTPTVGTTPDDFDSDTIANYLDLDSDADGIPDTIEAFPTAGYTDNDGDVTDNDGDGDGVIDLFDTTALFGGTFTVPENTDDTDNQDYLDTDSDNDTLLDSTESGLTRSPIDAKNDGISDHASIGASYSDPNGVINNPSADLDNEVGDITEVGYREVLDKDSDLIADAIDIDDDNDGILDVNEGESWVFPNPTTGSPCSECTPAGWTTMAPDTPDISSQSNWIDGAFHYSSTGAIIAPSTPSGDTTFLTVNRVEEVSTSFMLAAPEILTVYFAGFGTNDTGMGPLNAQPGNTANLVINGTPVPEEAIPWDGEWHARTYALVAGGNTISFNGNLNNIPQRHAIHISIPANQTIVINTDGDTIGDFCDLDSDNDGISDLTESGFANPQYDLNNDGTISIAEAEAELDPGMADIDNDGLLDIFDADTASTDPTLSAGTTPDDFDSDTIANHLDLDSDADGIPDTIEAFPTAGYSTNDGDVTDNDADGDGIIDLFDGNDLTTGDFGGTFSTPQNTDGVDNQDYLDTNSDNDALLDSAESGLTLSAVDANGDGIDDDASIGASYSDPDGVIDTPSTDLANEFGDTSEVGYREAFIPIILTQYYENGDERWIEVTNISTSPIAGSAYKIAFFNESIPNPDGATPTATYDISGGIPAGASLLIHATASNSGTPPSSGTLVADDGVTNFDGDDRLALTTTTDNTAWASRVDAIGDGSIGTNRSLVRIDEVSAPNTTFTPSEWINFLGNSTHPHDPLLSEVDAADTQSNNRLGVHQLGCTTYTGGSFDNGLYDRSRCVIIDQDNSHTGGLEARTLEVTTGNTLTMTTDDLLVVTNSITLDGDIVLSGDAQLIQTHTGANQVSGNGELLRDQQGNGLTPSEFRYSYWGAPVVTPGTSTYSIGDVMRDAGNPGTPMTWVTGFNGANQATSPITQSSFWLFTFLDAAIDYSSWVAINNNTQLAPATGYTMKNPGSSVQNYTFRGTPNDGVYTHSITAGNKSLLSNPYPSALSVAQFIADNLSITGTLYVWEQWSGDSHNLALYEGGYHSVTGAGSTLPETFISLINPNTNLEESLSIPGKYIPVGQGFFVEGGAGGTVTFNNGQREFQQEVNDAAGNGAFSRNANTNTAEPTTDPRFFLDFIRMNDGVSRRLLAAFLPNNTLGFDHGYDGIRYSGDDDTTDAWFILPDNNERFVIQAPGPFNENMELPLEVHIGSDGDYRFRVDTVLNFEASQYIYLRNNATYQHYNLTLNDATIMLAAGIYTDLFSIVFKESALLLDVEDVSLEEDMFVIYPDKNTGELVIFNHSSHRIKDLTLFNLLGQTIIEWTNKEASVAQEIRIPIEKGLSKAIYIATIHTDNDITVNKKIGIQKE